MRAILQARPLPSSQRFYRRRALRIWPAYWVSLAILVMLPTAVHHTTNWLTDVAAHVFMVHDAFPVFNQDYEGPFWTLAIEWQFYMLLPLIAAGIARLVRRTRSVWRLVGGVLALIVLALLLRRVDVLVMAHLTQLHGTANTIGTGFVLATMGYQGKNLEVFAVGMLCSVLYVVTVEQRRISQHVMERLGYVALAISVAVFVIAVPQWAKASATFAPGAVWEWDLITYPLLVGVGYGALALVALWGGRALRIPFELAPLRFIGLISYSLYLWHLPNINQMIPVIRSMPLMVRVIGAFVIAYLSYQLVERPFLRRRHRESPQVHPVPVQPEIAVRMTSDAI